MIGIGVIGYGYWGPNLVRNFLEVGAQVVAVSDLREERLKLVKGRYPAVHVTRDHRELLADKRIDAIVVATPVHTHFELAFEALAAGKHVLVEKPMTMSSEQGQRLCAEAARRQRILMVDHTFVYSGAVRKLKSLITSGSLGEIYYYDGVRVNLGLFQHDVNVLWDLAVHDLSIMDHLLPARPRAVSATGVSHVPGGTENIAYLTLFFENSMVAHLHVNWLAPVKIRRTLIGGSQKMVVYDDLEPSEKIKIYDRGITVDDHTGGERYRMLVEYRIGDMLAPNIDLTEALRVEAQAFLRCIEQGEQPETDGASGLRVVSILEAASKSMAERGCPVELDPGVFR